MMRIIAGQWKGRALAAPSGSSTRPTADRARQALFNRIEHAPWSPGLAGARVLDLFAGTGALGLEALSRGAAHSTFAERDPGALKALKANIAACRCVAQSTVLATDALAMPPGHGPFDLIFADPPYHTGAGQAALAALPAGSTVANAVAILETSSAEPPVVPDGWMLEDVRDYGAARTLILLRRRLEEHEGTES